MVARTAKIVFRWSFPLFSGGRSFFKQ